MYIYVYTLQAVDGRALSPSDLKSNVTKWGRALLTPGIPTPHP